MNLSSHEPLCLKCLHFERYFSHHQAISMITLRIFIANIHTWTETKLLADLVEKLHDASN